jgi:hypothetical protein
MPDRNNEAQGLHEPARDLYARAGVLTGEVQSLAGLAELAEMKGEREAACRLYANAEALSHDVSRCLAEVDSPQGARAWLFPRMSRTKVSQRAGAHDGRMLRTRSRAGTDQRKLNRTAVVRRR